MNERILFTMAWFHALVLFLPLSMFLLYKWPKLWHHLLAVFLGLIIAIIDLHSDEVQFSVLMLLAFGFFLGFDEPSRAWRWGMLLAIWIPVMHLASTIVKGSYENFWNEAIFSFIAIVPALIGAYAGRFIRNKRQAKPEATIESHA